MAIIYEFRKYQPPELLRSFSYQAENTARALYDMSDKLRYIHARFDTIGDAHRLFSAQLTTYLSRLEKAQDFFLACSAACELNSVEQMIRRRDEIIHEKQSSRARV